MENTTASDTGAEMETVTSADGTEIAFERTGSGPPLVLVHGAVSDHRVWEMLQLRSPLSEHFTLYAMERRGHGESGDDEPYEIERVFEDVVAVVDAVDEAVALFGYSTGGLYALEAARRTDNVRRLLLYEPALLFGAEPAAKEAYAEMMTLLADGEDEEALALCLRAVAHLSPEEIDMLRSAPTWQDQIALIHTVPLEIEAIAGGDEFDPGRFEGMGTPTLLLTGGESAQPYREWIDQVSDALPNSHVATIEGHGHVGLATAPEQFLEEVITFASTSA